MAKYGGWPSWRHRWRLKMESRSGIEENMAHRKLGENENAMASGGNNRINERRRENRRRRRKSKRRRKAYMK
jgi:hypothetical protein